MRGGRELLRTYRRAAESWDAHFGETRCGAGLSVTPPVRLSGRRRAVLPGFPSLEVSGGLSLGQPSAELSFTEQAVVSPCPPKARASWPSYVDWRPQVRP